jgi:hypothetical protein
MHLLAVPEGSPDLPLRLNYLCSGRHRGETATSRLDQSRPVMAGPRAETALGRVLVIRFGWWATGRPARASSFCHVNLPTRSTLSARLAPILVRARRTLNWRPGVPLSRIAACPSPTRAAPCQRLSPSGRDSARPPILPGQRVDTGSTSGAPLRLPMTGGLRSSPRASRSSGPQASVRRFLVTPKATFVRG